MPAAERDWFRDIPGNKGEQCAAGASTDHPCPRPATVSVAGGYYALCPEHAELEEVAKESNELGCAVELLDAWIWEARGHDNQVLEESLCRLKNGLSARHREAEFRVEARHKLLNGERIDFGSYE